jgi:hypothetical protein
MPDSLSIAATHFRDAKALLGSLEDTPYPFILREGNIMTFSDLSEIDNILSSAISEEPRTTELAQFLKTDGHHSWILALLNIALHRHATSLGLVRKKGKHFFPSYDNKDVRIKWHTGTRLAPRNLAKWYFTQQGRRTFCKHKAVTMRFRRLGDSFYLVLNPGFHFSMNGIDPLNPRLTTKLSSGAWARHGNSRLLYDVRFWTNFLAQKKGAIEIETGCQPIVVDTMPLIGDLEVGIGDDSLPNTSFLEPIANPTWRIFQAAPTRQTSLDEELYEAPILEDDNVTREEESGY